MYDRFEEYNRHAKGFGKWFNDRVDSVTYTWWQMQLNDYTTRLYIYYRQGGVAIGTINLKTSPEWKRIPEPIPVGPKEEGRKFIYDSLNVVPCLPVSKDEQMIIQGDTN